MPHGFILFTRMPHNCSAPIILIVIPHWRPSYSLGTQLQGWRCSYLNLTVLGLTVLGLTVLGLTVLGLTVLGLAVLNLAAYSIMCSLCLFSSCRLFNTALL